MVEDITPTLLDECRGEFNRLIRDNKKLERLYAKIRDGTATYTEANKFSVEVGNCLAKTFKLKISSEVLPDGRMYFNIADRLLHEMFGSGYNLISDYTATVQKAINQSLGLGIAPVVPELNDDRIMGIVNRISSELEFDKIAWILDDPVINLCQSIVDEFTQQNSKLYNDLGFKQTITRTCVGKCCEWCKNLEGVYDYDTVRATGSDVYRKHENCRCETTPNFSRKMRPRGRGFIG